MTTERTPLDKFILGYMEAMFFCLPDDEFPDRNELTFADLHPDTVAEIERECKDFYDGNSSDLLKYVYVLGFDYQRAGNDFFYTRNGHGTGFWDRDFSNEARPILTRLSDASSVYGETNESRDEDGKVHSD